MFEYKRMQGLLSWKNFDLFNRTKPDLHIYKKCGWTKFST